MPQNRLGGGRENLEFEEALSALDRAKAFGTSKLSLRRLVCVNELVDTAHEIGYESTVTSLLPLVSKLAADPEVLVRQSLVNHFGDLAGFLIQSDPEQGYKKVVKDLLPIVELLLKETASEVRQGAADALCTLASHLRPGERGDTVLGMLISLTQSNDDEDARTTAVQLLNGLAEALGPERCQQFVGVTLVALCEDPSFRVRKATAANFQEVARMVGDEYTLRRLLPAFGSLVRDSHWGVRKAAAESLVPFAMAISVEHREESFVPLVHSLLKDTTRWVLTSAVQQLGYFIAALEAPERVPEELLMRYVEIIEQTQANPDAADAGFHCASTFAAVTKTVGVTRWPLLQAAFSSLSKDSQPKTRKAMAASLHVIAETLGPDLTEKEVIPHFEASIQDRSQEVRVAAISARALNKVTDASAVCQNNVARLLRALVKPSAQKRVLKALSATIMKADCTWRARLLVASQLGPICEALEPEEKSPEDESPSPSRGSKSNKSKDLIWSILIPLFLHLCTDVVSEVRDEAARATARALKAACPELLLDPASGLGEGSSGCSTGLEQMSPGTAGLVRHLLRTFARSKTFRNRIAFIRMCDSVIRESPLHIFTDILLRPLIQLSVDKVKNVRLCWVLTILPHMRKAGRLGTNSLLLGVFARIAKEDTDREVQRLIPSAGLDLSSGMDLPELDSEHDFDEPEIGEGFFTLEGGTGDSSECSDVGMADEEEEERREVLQDTTVIPASSSSAAPASDVSEQVHGSARQARQSPPMGVDGVLHGLAAVTAMAGPKSPNLGPTGASSPGPAPGHDAVEDCLVEQTEIDRDLDATFADRRLLAEAEAAENADELGAALELMSAGAGQGYRDKEEELQPKSE